MEVSDELRIRKKEIERKRRKLEELKKKHANRQNKFYHLEIENKSNTDGMNENFTETLPTANFDQIIKVLDLPNKDMINFINEDSLVNEIQQNLLKKSMKSLSIVSYPMIDFPKNEVIYYTKNTQTICENNLENNRESCVAASYSEKNETNQDVNETENYRSNNYSTHSDENAPEIGDEKDNDEASSEAFELNEEKINDTMKSKLFNDFFYKACNIIERAQGTQTDVCFDYGKELASNRKTKMYDLDVHRCLFNPVSCKNKTISCLEWSSYYPELVLASYVESNADFGHINQYSNHSSQNPDGCVLVWNSRFSSDQQKEEYSFHFQSPITSACFSPFHPNVVLGGTYSGRILLWDNRTGKMMPVCRSNVSTACHTYPVFCTQIIGSPNSHNLVSLSSDGRLCTWSLDMLTQPTETIDLAHKKARTISATSMSFHANNINHCMVGSEEGTLYNVQRLGSKTGIVNVFDAHFGPITNVHYHPDNSSTPELSRLYLSSSMDWTVKLWDVKHNQPLLTFEDYNDYICDVKWSPNRPSMFACVDSQGKLDIWDINRSFESPIASITTINETPLTKVSWSSNGNYVATGGEGGRIEIYNTTRLNQEVNDNPKHFIHVLEKLKEKCGTFVGNTSNHNSNNLPASAITTTASPTNFNSSLLFHHADSFL